MLMSISNDTSRSNLDNSPLHVDKVGLILGMHTRSFEVAMQLRGTAGFVPVAPELAK